jgi:RimJ/RimL family protein N-acetyltransferase
MTTHPTLETPRLLLRPWRASDREPFARLNADPHVMEFFPALLTPAETYAAMDRIEAHHQSHGFGLLAAELRTTGEFIGYLGLAVPNFETAFTPCVEIGWRLAVEHWGHGYATEGAQALMHHAFATLMLSEVVSFTVPANLRSRRVMEKLGMTRNPAEDFDHPRIPEGHPLRRHVLYRLSRNNESAV